MPIFVVTRVSMELRPSDSIFRFQLGERQIERKYPIGTLEPRSSSEGTRLQAPSETTGMMHRTW